MAYIYDLTDTWNAGGTTFYGIKMNVTNTASASGSKLLSLQVGGSEKFGVDKDGNVGVGTASPSAPLHVKLATDRNARFLNAYTGVALGATTDGGSETKLTFFGNPLAFVTNDTERMRIDASGNVGIGTATPDTLLHVQGNDPTVKIVDLDGTTRRAAIQLQTQGGDWTIEQDNDLTIKNTTPGGAITTGAYVSLGRTTGSLILGTSGAEQMRITSAGNVGIGTSSPGGSSTDRQLTVLGTTAQITASNGTTNFNLGMNASNLGYLEVSGANPMVFSTNSSERMRIDSSGNVGIGTSSPVSRLQVSEANRIFDSVGNLNVYTTDAAAANIGGSIGFGGTNTTGGSSPYVFAKIQGIKEGSASTWNGAMIFGTTAASSAMTERMRIDSSGNLLVGTTSANGKLSVVGNQISIGSGDGPNTLGIQIKGTALSAVPAAQVQGYIATGDSSMGVAGDLLIAPRTDAAANIRFITGTSPAERMRIDSSGNLLVGKTSTANEVTTDGLIYYKNASGGGSALYATNGGTGTAMVVATQADVEAVVFYRSGTNVGNISVTTTSTAYNTSSDYRLKDIDGPIQNSGAYIDALKPVQGSWKADGSRFIGLIAHEVQEVSETQIATGVKDGDEMQAMDYSAPELIANLIAEIQSLRARVAQLEGN